MTCIRHPVHVLAQKIVTRNNFTIFKCQIAKKVESITYPRHDKMDKHRAYC